MTRNKISGRLFFATFVLTPTAAHAELVRWQLEGTLEVPFRVGSLPEGIAPGAPFVALLSYDSATLDEIPDDPRRGQYGALSPIKGALSIYAGPTHIEATNGVRFWIGDDLDDPSGLLETPDDTFRYLTSSFSANFDFTIGILNFSWRDSTRRALTSDRLPTELDADAFQDPFIEISTVEFDSRVTQFTALANVDTIRKVPEPGSLGGVCVALLAALTTASKPIQSTVSSMRRRRI